jgi:hypothetical protein
MNKLPSDHPYRRHAENLRRLSVGLTQSERIHKDAIRRADSNAMDYAARMHHLTVGLVAEAALRKILHDPSGFNDKERQLIQEQRNQLDKWKRAVELGFRRHHQIPIHLEIDATTAAATPTAAQYEDILSLLDGDLAGVIEDRNKIAHGQWEWMLNSRETAFTGPTPAPLNYRAIESRSKIIRQIGALINDLVVSPAVAFKRDFASHFALIDDFKKNLDGGDYQALVQQLRSRRRAPDVGGPSTASDPAHE